MHPPGRTMSFALLGAAIFSIAFGAALATTKKPEPAPVECSLLPHGPQATECYAGLFSFDTESEFLAVLGKIEAMVSDPTYRHFQVECHEVTHELGRRAANLFPQYQKFYKTTPSLACMAGLQHGLLEAELDTVSNERLAELGMGFCEGKLSHSDRCVHLLGHITLLRSSSTNFDDKMTLVRSVCGNLTSHSGPDSAALEFRCYDGAYMEASLNVRRATSETDIPKPVLAYCSTMLDSRMVEAAACIYQLVQVSLGDLDSAQAVLDECERYFGSKLFNLHEICVLGLTNFLGVLEPIPGQTPAEVCKHPSSLGGVCRSGFARSARNMAGYGAMVSVCRDLEPDNTDECERLGNLPLPVPYIQAGSLTDIRKEVSALPPGFDVDLGSDSGN